MEQVDATSDAEEKVPAGHREHALAPTWSENVPSGQLMQALRSWERKVPLGHWVGSVTVDHDASNPGTDGQGQNDGKRRKHMT